MRDKRDTIKKESETQEKRKKRFLEELVDRYCLGNVSVAAKRIGVARCVLYRWRKSDPNFAAAWDESKNEADDLLVDKAESALITAIDAGNITAIIFTLKTRAPGRWGDQQRRGRKEDGPIEDQYTISPEFAAAMNRFLTK